MKILTLLLILTFTTLAGCTHYLYQGNFNANDNHGTACEYQLYWTKTDPILGSITAGPGILQSTCSTPKTFADSTQGIVLELTSDQYQTQPPSTDAAIICAKVMNLASFQDYETGDLHIQFSCITLDDDFAAIKRSLPAPSDEAYIVPIAEPETEWSFGLDNAMAPAPFSSD